MTRVKPKLTALVGLICGYYFCAGNDTLQIPQGLLRGTIKLSREGRPFSAFHAIPFAEPPVGDRRLKPPIPHGGWQGLRDATKDAPICVQVVPMNKTQRLGQEDCLYLNVYTPKRPSNVLLPVMVFIHGGGFFKGQASSYFYGPEYFMDHNVVLVTIQYRLGVFGFLSFQNEQIPGNFGLKDQLLAFKWVKEHIGYFGGDSASVTIFGESSGAASVDLHLASPLSEGLFHRAILQSGSGVSPKFLIPQDVAKERAFQLARAVGCSNRTEEDLLKCLQDVPVRVLEETTNRFYWEKTPETLFVPTVEPFKSEMNFLPRPPSQLPDKKVPAIIGVNYEEGALTAARYCSNDYQGAAGLNAEPDRRIPLVLSSSFLRPEAKIEFLRKLEYFYLQNKTVGKDNFHAFINMISDVVFVHPAVESTRHHTDYAPVYFYLYNYKLPVSLSQVETNCSQYFGVAHGDDLIIFFKSDRFQYNLSTEDVVASNRMIQLWTSFARDGVPDDKSWRPTKSSNIDYLYISNKYFSEQEGLFTERVQFVDTLSPLFAGN